MVPFIIRRIAISIPLLLAASFLVFVLVANSGDPLENMRLNPRVTEAQIRQAEIRLHLNESVFERYGRWFGDIITGDFGRDNAGNPIWPQLWRAMKVTLRLVVVSIVLAVGLALLIGTISALRQYSFFDYATTFLAFLFFSLPVFWLAALLKEFAAIRLNDFFGNQWVYTVFHESPGLTGSFTHKLSDWAGHIFLPAFTLIAISFAQYSRFTRASMLDTLSADYVRTAEAKGVTRRRVVMNHALRNALIPVTTVVALDFGAVLGGTIITERVFQWRGMGTLLVENITTFDINVVQAWLMFTAIVVVIFNLLADIAYAYLDPRIRL